MKNKIFILLFIIGAVVWAGTADAAPCQDHNVWGWAWSENIGWISFSCRNTKNVGEGVDYGVDIDLNTGEFSGYAWSDNIGWISFDGTGATLDLETAEVSGWARALANGGGWDGWIKLRGIWPGGVTLNSEVGPPSEFEGWAWGSDVVGWVSFNKSNTGAGVDYKVMTDININPVPSADTLVATRRTDPASNCFAVSAPIDFTWRFLDPGDSQSAYQVQIATNDAFSPLFIDSGKVGGNSNIYTPFGLSYNTDYYWRLKVWDNGDPEAESDWIYPNPEKFNTGSRWPEPDFDISPLNPPAGAEVVFTDKSICYTASGDTDSCQSLANSYLWDFGDGETISQPSDEPMGDTTHIYADSGNYTVELKVSDNIGACSVGFPLTAVLRLPTWKEVSPF